MRMNVEAAFRKISEGPGLIHGSGSRPQSAHNSWILAAARTTSAMCKHGAMVCSRYAEVLRAMESALEGNRSFQGSALEGELSALGVTAIFDMGKKSEVVHAFSKALAAIEKAELSMPEIENEEEVEHVPSDTWVEEKMGNAEVLRDVAAQLLAAKLPDDQIPDPFSLPARKVAEIDPAEVARQSAWYLAPPDILNGAELISVSSNIMFKPFASGRPQTAQPALQRTRKEADEAKEDDHEEVRMSWIVR